MRRRFPAEDLVYFGDTGHVPYGTKSPETVRRLALAHGAFLARAGAKCLIVACNTASAVALEDLRRRLSIPVIGVIGPGVRAALATTRNRRIGVLGTPTTIASGAYQRELAAGGASVCARSCPLFVPLIEEGWAGHPVARRVAVEYLSSLRRFKVDTVILGCTHYPLMKRILARILGSRVRLVDSASAVAQEVERVLAPSGLLRKGVASGNAQRWVSHRPGPSGARGRETYYLTDTGGSFRSVARRFLGSPLKRVFRVNVGVRAIDHRIK
jgi:glutamate racemase